MRLALVAAVLSVLAAGCGGSSSETPPPLQPDPTSARYTGPRFPSADDEAPAPTPAEPDDDPGLDEPRRPAPATWGSGKATPSAPKMTSPTALPESGELGVPAAN